MRRRLNTGMQNSEDRLYKLVAQRLLPEANKAAIDESIWRLFGEEWCVMATDLSGFSRHVAEYGIIHFLQTLYESERLLLPIVENHEGFLLKTAGDSMMVLFRNPERAIQCAFEMFYLLNEYNIDKSGEEKILLCVGLGFGKLLRVGNTEVFGAEVNAASKLGEDVAKQGELLVTGAVKEACEGMTGVYFDKLDFVPPGADASYRVMAI